MRDLWLSLHTSFGFGINCFSCSPQANSSSGHTQQEHETRHGSMSRTRWAIDGPEGNSVELDGRKFSSNDDGAPMLCNLVCTSMGSHVHIDYCRGEPHDNPEILHINEIMVPNPDQEKDWITHGLHWRRMGEFVTRTFRLVLLMRFPGFKGNRNHDCAGYI